PDHTGSLTRARNGRILIQGRTPTGPFLARFSVGIILGLVAEFAFMGQSTKLAMFSSAARWKSRKQIGGLKCRPGCSTGRHSLTPGFWQLNRKSALRHLRRSPLLDLALKDQTPSADLLSSA